MTRHWVEAYADRHGNHFRVVCENPQGCGETSEAERKFGCGVAEWWSSTGGEILQPDREVVLGRLEVGCVWLGGEDPDLVLRPVADLVAAAGRADPDLACPHEHFEAVVAVARRTKTEGGPVEGFTAGIRVQCTQCREPFRWIGAPAGDMPSRPCVSVDETELRAPMRPASSDPDFGLGIPGFAIRYRQGGPQ